MSLILSGTDGLSDVDGSAATPAIRGTDANTGMFFPAADTIAFSEGGVESMRIDSAGNVGIGTNNPASFAKLAVNTATLGSQQTDGFFLAVNGTGRGGLLCTGTPYTYAGASANALWVYSGASPLLLGPDGATHVAVLTNGSERMRITSAGDVGIGTTNPQQKFVVSNAGAAGLEISPTAIASSPCLISYNRSGAAYTQLTYSALLHAWDTSGTERMRIDSSGRVGIGGSTVTDGHLLNIQGSTATNNIGIVLNKTNATAQIWGITNTGPLSFYDYTASTERMRVTSGGDLCVGATSSPTASTRLNVVGSGPYTLALNSGSFNYYFGTASNQFNVYSGEGTLRGYLGTAGTWTNTSDISFKKDIVDIKYGLQDVLNLRPVSYLTKDYEIPQIGFIAQEMEQVIPEVVSGEDGSKGISYGSLVALCVKSIQELKAELDSVKAELQTLKGN